MRRRAVLTAAIGAIIAPLPIVIGAEAQDNTRQSDELLVINRDFDLIRACQQLERNAAAERTIVESAHSIAEEHANAPALAALNVEYQEIMQQLERLVRRGPTSWEGLRAIALACLAIASRDIDGAIDPGHDGADWLAYSMAEMVAAHTSRALLR